MIRTFAFIALFSYAVIGLLQGQPYGDEWIVSGQTYKKIPVWETGLYAVPISNLAASGLNTSDPSRIQVWFRGQELAVHLQSGQLYFYGQRNDATLDANLYEPVGINPQKHVNLFADTTYYFVTIGSSAGKRMQVRNYSSTFFTSSVIRKALIAPAEDYSRGKMYFSETFLSEGDNGEGWMSAAIRQSGPNPALRSFSFPLISPITTSGTASLTMMLVGRNSNSHFVDILIGPDANNPQFTFTVPVFTGRINREVNFSFPSTVLSSSALTVFVRVRGDGFSPDFVSLASAELSYSAVANQNNTSASDFYFNSFGAGNLAVSNVPSGSFFIDLSSPADAKWMTASAASGTVELSPASGATRLYISNNVKSVSAIRNTNLSTYALSGTDFLIVTHGKLLSGARTYAQYRAGISGGNYDTLVTDVLRLYDLYTYGEKTPLALFRFFDQIIDNGFDGKVFLIGKGLHYDLWGDTDLGSNYYRFLQNAFINNSNETYRLEDLIPSAGYPASDNLYVADATKRPRVAISRLSARTNDDILQYLDKVQLMELQTDNASWRKEFLHLSGGNNSSEINIFKQYVKNFEAICESQWYAGNVRRSLAKNITSGAVDSRLIGSISDEVNKGLGYLTFLGHSSADIVDVDVGFVSNPIHGYSNYGKYPFMFMNGCSSAEFFAVNSVPEDWIMTPNKGAVMAMGHSDIGYTFQLYQYTMAYYYFAYNDTAFKAKSIAEIQKRVVDSILSLNNNELYRTQAAQFMLQGDPAMKMYRPELTDYQISGEAEQGNFKVFIRTFDGNALSAKTDSFQIGIPVQNLGAGNTRSIDLKVIRTNASGTIEYPAQLFPATLFLDTVYVTIKDQSDAYFGQNVFQIYIDYLDSIQEFNESNNKATLSVFIPTLGVKCLLPREFNIESSQNIRFVFQATDLTARNQKYRVELDTSFSFNSPGLKVFNLTGDATVIFESSLLTDILPSDSLVYFWRVRADNQPDDTIWENSSFTYIKNSPAGWSQSRIEEVFENSFNGLQLNPLNRQFSFKPLTLRFEARVAGLANPQRRALEYIKYNNIGLYYNGAPLSNCTENFGFHMLLVNGTNGITYVPSPLRTCGALYDYKPLISFYAPNLDAPQLVAEGTGDKWNSIMNTMAPGNLMFMVSTGDTRAGAGWKPTPAIQNQLQNDFGSYSVFANNSNARPFIFLSRKGSPIPIIDTLGLTDDQVIEVDTTVQIPVNEGTMTSSFIGPGYEWNTIYRKVKTEPSDSWNLSLIRFDGKLSVKDTIDLPDNDTIDISWINAAQYPFIKLIYLAEDGGNNTPPKWLEWQVIHKQAPEGYLDPMAQGEGYYKIPNRPEGDTLRLSFTFKNLTPINFISPLNAVITITGPTGKTFIDTIFLGELNALEEVSFDFAFNTKGWPGTNRIQCFVNPYLQPELYYFNNALETVFYVEGDLTHPLLDVAFDGVHIFDGDIVSPQPVISISLKDDNSSLPMPFSSVKVYLIYPGSNELKEVISTDAMVISWAQDHSDASRFLVEFQPKGLPDGMYTLLVQGTDASGNKAGIDPYRIRFEVINKSSITNFYPYPNPFSTSCRFVFTLTGSEIPDNFKIQIMTVNGKIVREIFKEELGFIHAGNNITDYSWDGTDQFGDRLANGVYLYRIVMRDTDTQFEHRETAADKAFKQGYGKLYILR